VGALSKHIEHHGVATTQISLIREHTSAINPPRALWVSFMLGRPLGVPNDAAFQERVLIAALRLLEETEGPLLVDYPEDAPASADSAGHVCPVSFTPEPERADLTSVFLQEVQALQPWHDLARERRGRSTVGLTGLPIVEAASMLARCARGEPLQGLDNMNAGETLKLACEDVRAYYQEAAAAQPGSADADAIQRWFWNETAGGRVFLAVHAQCSASEDPSLQRLCATSLIPRTVLHELQERSAPAHTDGV
jgi:hypothetical protein